MKESNLVFPFYVYIQNMVMVALKLVLWTYRCTVSQKQIFPGSIQVSEKRKVFLEGFNFVNKRGKIL